MNSAIFEVLQRLGLGGSQQPTADIGRMLAMLQQPGSSSLNVMMSDPRMNYGRPTNIPMPQMAAPPYAADPRVLMPPQQAQRVPTNTYGVRG